MMRTVFLMTVLLMMHLLSGCDPGIDKDLIGTWNVTRVEAVFVNSGTNSTAVVDEDPTGTVIFRRNGTGEQDYYYTVAGTQSHQTGSFRWSATDETIYIERDNEPDMEWTRVVNQENRQVATYRILVNATQSWDYTLTLER